MKKDQGSIQKWYVQDTKGGLVGPHSSDQIIELIQNGKIKVEAQVYNVDLNVWIAAHEVVHEASPHFLSTPDKTVAPEKPTTVAATPTVQTPTLEMAIEQNIPVEGSSIAHSPKVDLTAQIQSSYEPQVKIQKDNTSHTPAPSFNLATLKQTADAEDAAITAATTIIVASPEPVEVASPEPITIAAPVLESRQQATPTPPSKTVQTSSHTPIVFKKSNPTIIDEPFSGWSAPPKPNIFKEKHVVDLNSDPTGNIDYFALLNHHRKDQANPNKIQTAHQSTQPKAEDESELLEAVDFLMSPIKKNKNLIMTAAASLFIVGGVIGLVRSFTGDANREIAEIKNAPKKDSPIAIPQDPTPQGVGSGTNVVKKQSKSVSRLNYDKLMEQSRVQNQIGIAPPTPTPSSDAVENNPGNYSVPNQMISTNEPEIITEPPPIIQPPLDPQQGQGYQMNGEIQYPPVPNMMGGAIPGSAPGLIPPQGQPNLNGIDPNSQNTNLIDPSGQNPQPQGVDPYNTN